MNYRTHLSNLVCCCLMTSLIANANASNFSSGAELATAAFRAPVVIMAKKAEHDKKFKKAYLLSATANFICLTNDLFALYNLVQKNDRNYYKFTKAMWIGQDFASLLVKAKNMISQDSDKWEKVELAGEKKIDLMLSDFLKKLDIYILPSIEGVAAVGLCLNKAERDSSSLLLQAIVTGSRLLSDMLESEVGSTEQKIVIASSIVHALVLLGDLMKSNPEEPVTLKMASAGTRSAKPVDVVVDAAPAVIIEPVINVQPVVEVAIEPVVDAAPAVVIEPIAEAVVEQVVDVAPVAEPIVNIEPVAVAPVPEVVVEQIIDVEPVAEVVIEPAAPAEVVAPAVILEPLAEEVAQVVVVAPVCKARKKGGVGSREILNVQYVENGDLGLVNTPDGKRCSARVGLMKRKDYSEYTRRNRLK